MTLAAEIAAGGLESMPLVDAIIRSAKQKSEFQRRQGKDEPNMRGRYQGLGAEQMRRVTDAAMNLASCSKAYGGSLEGPL